jgi:glycosyltransferase involved in cell wall biosynthesis
VTSLSVIIPTYQHAGTIAVCLESVFAQTLAPSEIIVVNDGSTDGTLSTLAPFLSRITLVNQEHQGGNVARNNGFALSRGERVIFCDADVIMRRDMLERLSQALDTHPEASYAYTGFRFGWKRFRSFPFSALRLRRMNYIHTTSLIRREHFPGFDPFLRRFQDWDVWLTMLEQSHGGVFVAEELFRVVDDQRRRGISQWRPSFLYHIPWRLFGWMPSSVRRYEDAKHVVVYKHHLSV